MFESKVKPRRNRAKIRTGLLAVGASAGMLIAGSLPVLAKTTPHVTFSILIAGQPTSATNAPLNRLVVRYEHLHPNVHITYDILGPSVSSLTYLITKGSTHQAPTIVPGIQYNQATSGEIPPGLLVSLTRYMHQKDAYVGGKTWLSTYYPYAVDYYRNSNGSIFSTPGSEEATAIFYNKAEFAKAGIKRTPNTWAQWVTDMRLLKAKGISPFLFAPGSACTTSWYERKTVSSLIHSQLSQFEQTKQQVLTGVNVAAGIEKGVISMNNPRYAEAWKLLGQLKPYFYPGESDYEACGTLSATTPPLSDMTPFVQGKVAMIWDGTWNIPSLNQVFGGKYGVFPFPTITKATTTYASNLSFTGDVGGPNGSGIFSITTPKANGGSWQADNQAANFLEFVNAPQNDGPFIRVTAPGTAPVVKGAKVGAQASGLKALRPRAKMPVAVDGILDNELDTTAGNAGQRLVEGYVDGSLSFASFSKQWNATLKEAASNWAKANKVNLAKYK